MASTLEAAAKGLLSDPAWNRVFKNTYDAIEEQLNKILVAVAAVGLAVRFLSNLASGDLLCIVNAVTNATEGLDMSRLAGPAHASLAAYASQDPTCHDQIFNRGSMHLTGFMKYGPVFLILQAITLIAIEKIAILYPRMSQKLERFYKSVVEEALLGKDPDVAEDFSAGQFSTDKILRERQRQEICGALRGSNMYYNIYMVKNVLEVLMAVLFITVNILIGVDSQDETGICKIHFLDKPTVVSMQCRQKRYDVFIYLHYIFTATLTVHVLVNICSVVWGLPVIGLRRISGLIKDLRQAISIKKASKTKLGINDLEAGESKDGDNYIKSPLLEFGGEDFLFLFDLIAQSCGKSATLRVLSYTAPSFEKLCQPIILHDKIRKTEDTFKIEWKPAKLQNILHYDKLEIEEYIATIFSSDNAFHESKTLGKNCRSAEFKNLKGGTTKYMVTISAMVGNAKMKGVTIKTFLPPSPPQKLVCSSPEISQDTKHAKAKISWTPPKGEFEKYSLRITQLGSRHSILPSMVGHGNFFSQTSEEKLPDEIWLHKESQEHTAENLVPGERYKVELRSVTDLQKCLDEKAPKETIITKPFPPSNIQLTVTSDGASVSWSKPDCEGHSALVGYKVTLKTKSDGKMVKEEFKPKAGSKSVDFENLESTTEYIVALATLCRGNDLTIDRRNKSSSPQYLEAQSDLVEETFVALPRPPTNLTLESSQATSLKVKWDPPTDCNTKPSYNITVHALNSEVQAKMSEEIIKETETNIFTLKLPEIVGTGEPYEISVETVIQVSGKLYQSSPIKKVFVTKPLPPEKLVVPPADDQEFVWKRSMSPSVNKYKFKIKKDDDKATDFWIHDDIEQKYDVYHQNEVKFKLHFEFLEGVEYKINIYSLIEHEGNWIESEPLHGKVTKEDNDSLEVNSNEERKTVITLSRNTTNIKMGRKPSIKRKTSRQNTQNDDFVGSRLSNSSKS
eukprot:GFUD01017797.1.p1 GENE.GFUD01017797.1~~GFUD01017797.1.p1  ORF type:complete len:977 (-),score=204.76 GFUD01017797.1:255-3140(-)